MSADIPTGDTISPQWQRQIAIYHELAHKADLHADLVDTVDPRWRGHIQVQNGASAVRFLPVGDTLNQGRLLTVRAKARWSFELIDKPVHGKMGTVIKRKVAVFDRGGATLNEFLQAMFEGRDLSDVTHGPIRSWDERVASFRSDSYSERIKAGLLESVNPVWTHFSEANDNGQRLEIQRLGDTPVDGVKLEIRLVSDRFLFELRHQESTGRNDLFREAEGAITDAPVLLEELLASMLSDRVERAKAPHGTAQDLYKAMLRQQIAPALREMGFKGCGNNYEMARGEYQIEIHIQKSKWSTRDSVQFDANVWVSHPPTSKLFAEENRKARQLGKEMESGGSFHSRLNSLAGRSIYGFPWIVRPDEPTEPVVRDFLECVRQYFLPVIEEEIRRPLPSPTPLSDRAARSYKDVASLVRHWQGGDG